MMHTLSAQQTSINPNYKMFQPSPKTWQKRTGKSQPEFKGKNIKNMFTLYDDFVAKTTLKNTLDHVSNKKERIVGLPQTPEEFQKLPSVLRDHYWYHKPDVQQLLRQFSFTTLKEIEDM